MTYIEKHTHEKRIRLVMLYIRWEREKLGALGQVKEFRLGQEIDCVVIQTKAVGEQAERIAEWLKKWDGITGLLISERCITGKGTQFEVNIRWQKWGYPSYYILRNINLDALVSMRSLVGDPCIKAVISTLRTDIL